MAAYLAGDVAAAAAILAALLNPDDDDHRDRSPGPEPSPTPSPSPSPSPGPGPSPSPPPPPPVSPSPYPAYPYPPSLPPSPPTSPPPPGPPPPAGVHGDPIIKVGSAGLRWACRCSRLGLQCCGATGRAALAPLAVVVLSTSLGHPPAPSLPEGTAGGMGPWVPLTADCWLFQQGVRAVACLSWALTLLAAAAHHRC